MIAAERRGDTVEQLIGRMIGATGDQDAALSAIGLTELIYGIFGAQTPEIRPRRESFINELLADLTVYPYTKETALPAGKIDSKPGRSDSLRRLVDRRYGARSDPLVPIDKKSKKPPLIAEAFCCERKSLVTLPSGI